MPLIGLPVADMRGVSATERYDVIATLKLFLVTKILKLLLLKNIPVEKIQFGRNLKTALLQKEKLIFSYE